MMHFVHFLISLSIFSKQGKLKKMIAFKGSTSFSSFVLSEKKHYFSVAWSNNNNNNRTALANIPSKAQKLSWKKIK